MEFKELGDTAIEILISLHLLIYINIYSVSTSIKIKNRNGIDIKFYTILANM